MLLARMAPQLVGIVTLDGGAGRVTAPFLVMKKTLPCFTPGVMVLFNALAKVSVPPVPRPNIGFVEVVSSAAPGSMAKMVPAVVATAFVGSDEERKVAVMDTSIVK
jgi:hypothetical protein